MSSSVPKVMLAGREVGKMGYGLMQLTWTPEPPGDEVSFSAMKAAADAGSTAWSSATFYGPAPHGQYDNIDLIGRFFNKYPEYREKIVLVVKGGLEKMKPMFDLDKYREDIQYVTKTIGRKPDVWSIARLPHGHEKDEVFKGLAQLQKEGLFGYVGASELKKETLELMQKYCDVAVIEIEVSLWSYEQDIKDVVSWSATNKVPVFAYSPLGRGFLTRKFKSPEDIPAGLFQKMSPRFQGEAFGDNLKFVDQLDELAEKKGVPTSQMALAWVSSQSPYVIPIPGSSKAERVRDNVHAATIELSDEDLKGIDGVQSSFEIKGSRYPEAGMAHLMQ